MTTSFDTQAPADQTVAPQETFAPAPATPEGTQATLLEDGSVVVNGKIFKPEAIAKKIENADTHITTLERENAEKDQQLLDLIARLEAVEKGQNHKDALDRLVESAQPVIPAAPEPAPTQEISKEDLVAATLDAIKAGQVAETQDANLSACTEQARAIYGDAFGSTIDEMGRKHGMEPAQVVEMARNQPKVFKALFLPEQSPNGKPDTTGSTVMNTGQLPSAPAKQKSFTKMSAKERSALVKERMAQLANK